MIESVKLTDSERFDTCSGVFDISSVNDIDSVRFTEVAFAEIESVNDIDSESATLFACVSDISSLPMITDSVRFTEVAFAEIESVNDIDSESATLFAWVSDISNQ